MVDRILLWCDYFSMVPILVYFSGIYAGVYFNVLPEALSFTIFSFLNDQSTKLLKSIPYPDFMWDITRRPEGAFNTDYFSRNGPSKKDAPGFPSGHMTGITTFVLYMLLRKKGEMEWYNFIENNLSLFIFSVGIVCMMGFARWYKKCHNFFQILGGIFYGSFTTYIYYELIGKHLIK